MPGLSGAPVTLATGEIAQTSHTPLRSALRTSLAAAVAEIFGACAGGAVLTAWALHRGATPSLIGVLAVLPLAVQILQIPGAWLTLRFGAKRVAVAAIGGSRLIGVAMTALPFP